MNIRKISTIPFKNATINNLKITKITDGFGEEEGYTDCTTSISTNLITSINDNTIITEDKVFEIPKENLKNFYQAYFIAKQLPNGSTVDMRTFEEN